MLCSLSAPLLCLSVSAFPLSPVCLSVSRFLSPLFCIKIYEGKGMQKTVSLAGTKSESTENVVCVYVCMHAQMYSMCVCVCLSLCEYV